MGMALKIRNAIAGTDDRSRLEKAVRQALEMRAGEFVAVITHSVDLVHAEVVILQDGAWRASVMADLRQPPERLSSDLERALAAGA